MDINRRDCSSELRLAREKPCCICLAVGSAWSLSPRPTSPAAVSQCNWHTRDHQRLVLSRTSHKCVRPPEPKERCNTYADRSACTCDNRDSAKEGTVFIHITSKFVNSSWTIEPCGPFRPRSGCLLSCPEAVGIL